MMLTVPYRLVIFLTMRHTKLRVGYLDAFI
jgi:hypothetical protein